MRQGEPLTDLDRLPWLQELRRQITQSQPPGLVVACSALREAYREILRGEGTGGGRARARVEFVYLKAPPELIKARMQVICPQGLSGLGCLVAVRTGMDEGC